MSGAARGFSLIELLVAMAVATTCLTAMLALVSAGQSIARIQPEAADQQQRARAARQAIVGAFSRSGAGLDSGPLAGPLGRYFAPVVLSPEGGLTMTYVSAAGAQGEIALPFDASATTAEIAPSGACPVADATCAFTAGANALVFDASGCHDALRIEDVLPAVLIVRAAVRGCAFGAGASIAEGESRTFFVDTGARQLMRRDEATGLVLPVVDNVASMTVDLSGGGGRVRVTMRFASPLFRVPDFVFSFDAAAPNLQEAR